MCYHCNFKNKDRIHLGVQLFQGESRNSFVNLDMTKEGDNYYINVDLERYDQEFRGM